MNIDFVGDGKYFITEAQEIEGGVKVVIKPTELLEGLLRNLERILDKERENQT